MKLKNKRTGEIGDIAQTSNNAIIVYYPIVNGVATNPQHRGIYDSLAELNEEWEDYEEPKEYWYFDGDDDNIYKTEDKEWESDRNRKSIGNYFETKEEAEKAVEKLKAWKRLKEKGFRFKTYSPMHMTISYGLAEYEEETEDDLDLLFGGEE